MTGDCQVRSDSYWNCERLGGSSPGLLDYQERYVSCYVSTLRKYQLTKICI